MMLSVILSRCTYGELRCLFWRQASAVELLHIAGSLATDSYSYAMMLPLAYLQIYLLRAALPRSVLLKHFPKLPINDAVKSIVVLIDRC